MKSYSVLVTEEICVIYSPTVCHEMANIKFVSNNISNIFQNCLLCLYILILCLKTEEIGRFEIRIGRSGEMFKCTENSGDLPKIRGIWHLWITDRG